MNLKKIIKEELKDELDWIIKSNPSLHNKIIVFEPMIDSDEFNHVLDKLNTFNEMGDNIRWWSKRPLNDYKPLNVEDYLHHLIIGLDGRMVYGALWEIGDLIDQGYTEDQIRNDYEDKDYDINNFIDSSPDNFNSPEKINGREYFNLPYNSSINESEDFFDSIKDDEETPIIIPGGILDTLVGNFSQYEIMKKLHELGYSWKGTGSIFVENDYAFEPFRYIFIGPMGKEGEFSIPEYKILHDDNFAWIEEIGFSDLIYRT
jgi:hypothetical protein